MDFDTKIAIVIREDLADWQKLNVTAFLSTGIAGANPEILGEPYTDAAGTEYHPLANQPIIVLAADADTLKTIYRRAMDREVRCSLYIEDMFATGHDAANRATVAARQPDDLPLVGLGLRAPKRMVDRITKGARMHP